MAEKKKKKEIHSIHIEPAANGHMITTRFKGAKEDDYYSPTNEEKTVHEDCCGAADHVHDLLMGHDGESDHDIEGMEGEANENLAKHGYKKKSINDPKSKEDGKHPGFKKAEGSIEKKEHVSSKAAAAILASSTRGASKAAHKENPRLNRVKG
jgi:hypothetical protein